MYIMVASYVLADATMPSPHKSDLPPVRPVAVIDFNDGSEAGKEHSQMIHDMVKEAVNNLELSIKEYSLSTEKELTSQIEKISEEPLGLIVIIEPRNIDALNKIPSLYPDINFTVIGANAPLYFTNVRSMVFKDQEGAYMMGILAALRSKSGMVGFVSKDDTPISRNLAFAFLQGAKHTNPDILITEHLGDKINQGTSTTPIPKGIKIAETKADIIFVLDEELLDAALHNAQSQKRFIISYNHDLTNAYPDVVITSLLKHYDLAIYHTLRSYAHNEWRPGSQSLGIGNGFLDYVLNNSNKLLLPKETIEQMETNKDLVSQGIIQINNLAK
jgi:basic membrane protein A